MHKWSHIGWSSLLAKRNVLFAPRPVLWMSIDGLTVSTPRLATILDLSGEFPERDFFSYGYQPCLQIRVMRFQGSSVDVSL